MINGFTASNMMTIKQKSQSSIRLSRLIGGEGPFSSYIPPSTELKLNLQSMLIEGLKTLTNMMTTTTMRFEFVFGLVSTENC